MAKIPLTGGFVPCPEGTHIFKIIGVTYKEDFGKLEVKMKTADGHNHTERFSLLGKDGSPNQGALNAFSFFARAALNDYQVEDIDPQELVGHFVECDVEHDKVESTREPGKMLTFVKLTEKRPSEGYPEAEPAPAPAEKKSVFNLDDLLG